jgi:hypothetical protein
MFDIEIDISGLEAAWGSGVQALHAGAATAVDVACREGAREAVNSHLYQDRTAQLTASIHGDEGLTLTADGAEGQITAGEDYASYVDGWERGQREFGYMDLAHDKAEAVLSREMESGISSAEAKINSR